MAGTKSSPALGAGGAAEEAGREVLRFGTLEQANAGSRSGALSAEASAEGAALAQSPSRALLAQQRQGGLATAAAGRASSTGDAKRGAVGIARVADGVALPGSKFAQGRLDFVMQVGLRACYCVCLAPVLDPGSAAPSLSRAYHLFGALIIVAAARLPTRAGTAQNSPSNPNYACHSAGVVPRESVPVRPVGPLCLLEQRRCAGRLPACFAPCWFGAPSLWTLLSAQQSAPRTACRPLVDMPAALPAALQDSA